MATCTAQILIGRPHQNHGGITPAEISTVYLTENSKPCWIMNSPRNSRRNDGKPFEQIRWIPQSPQTILEDGLLFVAIHILRHEDLIAQAPKELTSLDSPLVDLGEVPLDRLSQLREACRRYDFGGNGKQVLILSVFCDSSINRQLPVIEEYRFDCEVLTPKFSRIFSAWSGSTSVTGVLS